MPQVTTCTIVQEEIQDKACISQQVTSLKKEAMQHQHVMQNRAAKLYFIALYATRIEGSLVLPRYIRKEDSMSQKLSSVETILG